MRTFLSRIVTLRPVAMGLAAGLFVAGILAVVGGSYAHKVVHDQLAPQKIFFPASAKEGLPANLQQYAGQQVDTGPEAKAYADKFINLHLQEIGGGKTYSEVSGASLANPKDEQLAQTTQTLFRGETLRGLLLNAWGWGLVGTVALIAGWVLIALGAILFTLPALDALLNRRKTPATATVSAPAAPASGD
jgi:hypothetical protein